MATDKSSSLKSAYELAMERLARKAGPEPKLTDEQKKALAEIDRTTRAKIAELEIMLADRIAKVQDNPEQLEKTQTEHRAAIEKIKSRAEAEKEKIRTP